MFRSLLGRSLWGGDLPSSCGFGLGDPVELPFGPAAPMHFGKRKADGSPVSVFIQSKKDLCDSSQSVSAKSLRHPHILRVLDSVEVASGFYLCTEPVTPLLLVQRDGEEDGKLAPEVWGLFQALEALAFLHSTGFVHGLFGPTAIFVTRLGEFRLGSFEHCCKNADASTMVSRWRESGPKVRGWPEPPTLLEENGVPSVAIDFWGAAVLIAYVFGVAKSFSVGGADLSIDLGRAAQDLPRELQGPFAELLKPKPLRGRSPIAEICALPYFRDHPTVSTMTSFSGLQLLSPGERQAFFDGLSGRLDELPRSIQTKQVLAELLKAQRFPGHDAAQILPCLLQVGAKLKEEEFKEQVAPVVAQLFASPDRAVRFRLLMSLGNYIHLMDDAVINDRIFPECVNGFTDSNAPIREATVKSLIHFVPRLKVKTVEARVSNLLAKMLHDPEPSIRTNAVICAGKLSADMPEECARKMLLAMLAVGLKDPFGPCRSASLQSLQATASIFGAEELAMRLAPVVCHRLVDADDTVAETAFIVMDAVRERLWAQLESRRALAAAEQPEAAPGLPSGGVGPAAQAAVHTGWGAWALSTAGSITPYFAKMQQREQGDGGGRASRQSNSGNNFSPIEDANLSGGSPSGTPALNQSDSHDDAFVANDDSDLFGDAWCGEEDEDIAEMLTGPLPPSTRPALAAAPLSPAASSTPPARQTAAAPKPKVAAVPLAKSLEESSEDFWKQFDM